MLNNLPQLSPQSIVCGGVGGGSVDESLSTMLQIDFHPTPLIFF